METATTAQVCTARQVGQVHEALSPIEETHPGTGGVAMTALQNAKRDPNSQCTRMAISEQQADAEVPGKHFGRAKVGYIAVPVCPILLPKRHSSQIKIQANMYHKSVTRYQKPRNDCEQSPLI